MAEQSDEKTRPKSPIELEAVLSHYGAQIDRFEEVTRNADLKSVGLDRAARNKATELINTVRKFRRKTIEFEKDYIAAISREHAAQYERIRAGVDGLVARLKSLRQSGVDT